MPHLTEPFTYHGVSYAPWQIQTLLKSARLLRDAYALTPPDIQRLIVAAAAASALPIKARYAVSDPLSKPAASRGIAEPTTFVDEIFRKGEVA